MNPVAEALTGWTEADAIGVALSRVFVSKVEATGEAGEDIIAGCLASGDSREFEGDVILVSRDGTGRGVDGTASPVRDQDGHTIGAVLVFKDVTDLQEEQRRLTYSANHDVLTGLPNRSAFSHVLAEARRVASSGSRQHALLFIDLDRFKPVNDTAGHAAGDELLKQVAAVIRTSCRTPDFAARMGGDEFVVLLFDCPLANARTIAQKIADSIAAIDFRWNGSHYAIGASVGIAPISREVDQDVLRAADEACYAAKAAGRGRVVAVGD
jgi:diguanylate cyclase (GGDEF)-like protein/PAS domain S-box-containing protein